jgi:hypothetical protein
VVATIEGVGNPYVGKRMTLNATFYNVGQSEEVNLRIQLIIDGSLIEDTNIGRLFRGMNL